MDETEKVGIVILAAGASTRFGSPKQLAKYEGETLIERILKTAISTGYETVVVLGANADRIEKAIVNTRAEIVVNNDWQCGMGSSIGIGIKFLLKKHPEIFASILLLCDQPSIKKETLLGLVERQRKSQKPIVASSYSQTLGTPALFTKEIFPELLELDSKKGAKSLIRKHLESNVASMLAPEASLDIDEPKDLENL